MKQYGEILEDDDFTAWPPSWLFTGLYIYSYIIIILGSDVAIKIIIDGLNDKNASDLSCVNYSTPSDHSELRCAERFFLDNSSSSSGNPICIPLCKSWLTVEAEDVAFSVCLIALIISSIILIIVARLRKDGM